MADRNRTRSLGILLAWVLLLAAPAAAEVALFSEGTNQISSLGVLDIAQDLRGNLYFATDNGLTVYDGAWNVTHPDYWNLKAGILSDHILAVEFDHRGDIWMGFPNGVQRMEGGRYVTTADQQLLKSLDVHELARVGKDMWIAAGNAGLHRYRDGEWVWFQPYGSTGLGCNYVRSMAVDPGWDWFYVACNEGIWILNPSDEPEAFTALPTGGFIPAPVKGVKSDPFGGVYIFNSSAVLHHEPPGTWRTVVLVESLTPGIEISDLGIDSERYLWIATNNGIYAWKDGRVREHLDTSRGIRNNAVKRIFIDGRDRVWFVTPENVGYYPIARKVSERGPVIPVTTFQLPPTVSLSPPVATTADITPEITVKEQPEATTSPRAPAGPLDGILEAIRSFLGRIFGGG